MEDDLLAACLNELDDADCTVDYDLPDEDIASLMQALHPADSASDDTSSVTTTKKRRNRKRAVHELVFLRDQVVEYTRQLGDLQSRLSPHTGELSVWQERSLRQATARKAAEDENQALKDMLQRQVQMAESLMKIVSKRPRVAEMTYLNKWRQSRTLGLDPAERRANFHSLLDSLYGRLENVFIAQRLFDPDSLEKNIVKKTDVAYDEHSRDIVFNFTATEAASVDFVTCANVIWEIYSAAYETPLEITQPLEWFDENALMVKMLLKVKKYDLIVHQHMGCKRYVEKNRVVMVFDSILDDQMHPYPAGVYVTRETAWLAITKTGDNECSMAFYSQGNLPCKSTEGPDDDAIYTMAFAEHMMDCYKRSIEILHVHLHGKLGAHNEPSDVSPRAIKGANGSSSN